MKKQNRQEKSAAPVQKSGLLALPPKTLSIVVITACLIVLITYLLRLDRVVGLYGDDAWYLLLAKALASGQGYTLINSPSPNIMPFYPPGFSFLLSLVWRLAPQFPQNIWLLKSISIVAMLGTGAVAYYYFWWEREQPQVVALGLAFVTVSSPAFIFLATSTVMSECVFTLVLLSAIAVLERCIRAAQNQESQRRVLLWAILGAGITAYGFLLRSIAVGLAAAAMLYILKHRLFKVAALYLGVTLLLVSPWVIYSRLHAPTAEQQAEQNSYITQSYGQQFWQRKASYTTEGNITLAELPARVWDNAYHLLEYDFGALVLYPMYRAIEPSESRLRYWWHDYTSLGLSALIIAGFIIVLRRRVTLAELASLFLLALIVMWPFRPFRYVLPLLPFVLFYLLTALQSMVRWLKRAAEAQAKYVEGKVALQALGFLFLVNLWSNSAYILSLHGLLGERPRWVRMFDDNENLIHWVGENLPRDAVITSQNPALVHLYTGHKGVGSTEPAKNWERWKQLQVRYLVLTSYFNYGEPRAAEKRFKELYRLPVSNLRVLDFGEPATRPDWPE